MKGERRGATAFEQTIYDAVREVPHGMVTTYKDLAERVGCRSYRAVGQALARNPDGPEVPCHRVIRSDLSVGGFFGDERDVVVRHKQGLLEAEGVCFDGEGRMMEPGRVYRF
jgi:methylated-DNA-[protein]-cysteine S-methyltransferase